MFRQQAASIDRIPSERIVFHRKINILGYLTLNLQLGFTLTLTLRVMFLHNDISIAQSYKSVKSYKCKDAM